MTNRLKDIGNTLMMPERIDDRYRVSKYQRRNMRVVDLIPVNFSFLANSLKDLEKINENKFNGQVLKYDYLEAIKKFRNLCKQYGINKFNELSGVRLWLTDETSSNESFTNNYTTNLIEQAITNLGSKYKSFSQLHRAMKSSSSKRGLDEIYNQGINTIANLTEQLKNIRIRQPEDNAKNRATINSITAKIAELKADPKKGAKANIVGEFGNMLGISTDSTIATLLKGLVGVIGKGETFNMPKIWGSSDYSPSMSLNIKLVSPYGSPKAIKKFIVEPLLCLLILTAPRSSNNVTIGEPNPLRVKTYGINNINFGAVKNISIRRGGGNTTYNKYRQPLSLELSLQIETLFGGFASLSTGDDITINDFNTDVSGQGSIDDTKTSVSFTTIGDVIKSFRPFTQEVSDSNYQTGRTYNKDGFYDRDQLDANIYYTRTEPIQTFAEKSGTYIPSPSFGASTIQVQAAPNNASSTATINSLDDKKTI